MKVPKFFISVCQVETYIGKVEKFLKQLISGVHDKLLGEVL